MLNLNLKEICHLKDIVKHIKGLFKGGTTPLSCSYTIIRVHILTSDTLILALAEDSMKVLQLKIIHIA